MKHLTTKQGFYNYSYSIETPEGIDPYAIGGSFAQTRTVIWYWYIIEIWRFERSFDWCGRRSSFQLLN